MPTNNYHLRCSAFFSSALIKGKSSCNYPLATFKIDVNETVVSLDSCHTHPHSLRTPAPVNPVIKTTHFTIFLFHVSGIVVGGMIHRFGSKTGIIVGSVLSSGK